MQDKDILELLKNHFVGKVPLEMKVFYGKGFEEYYVKVHFPSGGMRFDFSYSSERGDIEIYCAFLNIVVMDYDLEEKLGLEFYDGKSPFEYIGFESDIRDIETDEVFALSRRVPKDEFDDEILTKLVSYVIHPNGFMKKMLKLNH